MFSANFSSKIKRKLCVLAMILFHILHIFLGVVNFHVTTFYLSHFTI